MAYNVLKGNVQFINSDTGSIESMVDNYSNQTIGGQKTFTSALTASAFFVTSSVGGISQVVSSPISSISNASDERIAIFSSGTTLEGKAGLTYNDTVFTVAGNITASLNVSGSGFYGSGIGLTGVPAASLTGQVSAANINIGNGLHNSSTAVAVSASNTSITVASTGISINGAGNTSGLVVEGSGLRVDPNRGTTKGSLAGNDEFLIADSNDSNSLKKSTVTVLESHMNNTLTFAKVAGSDTQIFFNNGGSNTLGADSTFIFNDTTKIVGVTGLTASSNISASAFYGNGENLTNLNAANIAGNVSAANINIGNGLFNDSGALAVSASHGLKATSAGVEVTASSTSGLDVTQAGGLAVDPSRATSIGSLATADVLLVADTNAANALRKATLSDVTTLVKNNGAGGANTQVQFNNSNAFAGDSNFTFNAATDTLSVPTLSASANIHVTGANPQIKIGAQGIGPNDGMISIRPNDTNNKVLALMTQTEASGNRVIFGVTGSAQVLIGGTYFGGVLNVSGSDTETLIATKGDTNTTAFKVEGNGNTFVSGSLTASGSFRARALHMTTHKFTPGSNAAQFVRFDANGSDTSAGDNNKLVAPFSGRLVKVVARGTNAPGSTVIGLHTNTDGNQNVNGTATEEITANMPSANTTVTFTFTNAANYGPDDIVGIKINPSSDPGTVVMTSVWEFDQNS